MNKSDYLVIGGGIVGLACAHELHKRHPRASITVLEKEPACGLHASGRNSGGLHSGIYYKPGSLKARFCAEGAKRMREFAKTRGVRLLEKGKLIVATRAGEIPELDRLFGNAAQNGVRAERLETKTVKEKEPYAMAEFGGLFVEDTAVIDSKAVMSSLSGELDQAGIEIRTGARFASADPSRRIVKTEASGEFAYGSLINCAGAWADRVAACWGVGAHYALVPFKGLYYKLAPAKAEWVRSNIYPVPDPEFPFLGIHFTRLAGGEVHAGPTAIPAFGRENYGLVKGLKLGESARILKRLGGMFFSPDPTFRKLVASELSNYLKPFFLKKARRLLPGLESKDLVPCDKVGIRPQLVDLRTGKLEMDFVVETTGDSVHVLNAISPAFTSAFAFAGYVADRVDRKETQHA